MNKIIGYFLLCVGLALIFFATISMFKVFVNKQAPVKVLNTMNFSVNTQYGPMGVNSPEGAATLNLVVHALLMFFMVSVGARVSTIGVNLVKVDAVSEAIAKLEDIKKL
ncbi:hypothetical protein Emin_0029 [Elusimicrobium minutum Pei191]|uniref:Uncharacterized protein n=1 Tax=Elusimicrobium minutum (strain Pei191) TaxID=445932 RepID=B2KAQ1_ELUMP|nr:hypothetical protein [Elusimicrobium minutum]ACC97597.1 hypothetical protein Emin_0029 [Elusimicrobium minutum Pei191]